MSSGCFDCTEPSLSTSLQGKQGMKGGYALVRGGSSTSYLVEPSRTTSLQSVEFCHMSSGWFDCTEPSLSTSLQGKQGVQGAYALVRGGSSTSNLKVEFIPLQLPTNSLRRTKANGPADQAKRTKRKVRRTFCLVCRSLGPPDRSLGP